MEEKMLDRIFSWFRNLFSSLRRNMGGLFEWRRYIVILQFPHDAKKMLGDGLTVQADPDDLLPEIAVNTGAGLTFVPDTDTGEGKLIPNLGDGLSIRQEKITLELNTDPVGPTTCFDALTAVDMQLTGNILALNKTTTTFNVVRNQWGLVVDVVPGATVTTTDTITLPGGYGYVAMSPVGESATEPNFYKK
jgi:hypothetical protein